MKPAFSWNAFCDGVKSTETPNTFVLAVSNCARSSENAHSSAVHTEVNASGKNASRTFFSPRRN